MKNDYASQILMQEIWPNFIRHFESDVTEASYRSDISEFMNFTKKDFLQISNHDVERFYDSYCDKVSAKIIVSGTLTKKMRELSSLATFICENRVNYQVPDSFQNFFFPYLSRLEKQPPLANAIPIEHIDRLLKAAENNLMAYCILVLLFRAGLSSTEIIELSPSDLTAYDNGVYAKVVGRYDLCLIPEDAVVILEKYLGQRENKEFLFYNSRGNKLNTMYISRLLRKYTTKAEIPAYSAENLRNACAFTMFSYGTEAKQVAKQMGVTTETIIRYKGMYYRDNLKSKADYLIKVRVEPPI